VPDAAFAMKNPPPPNVTATAAPIAAHRDLHNDPRLPATWSVLMMPSSSVGEIAEIWVLA
jgi:hypothetical protein